MSAEMSEMLTAFSLLSEIGSTYAVEFWFDVAYTLAFLADIYMVGVLNSAHTQIILLPISSAAPAGRYSMTLIAM